MKTILSRVRRFVSGLSMRTKLIVAFSVPVMLVMALTMLGVHRFLIVRHEEQALSSAMSSYSQSYDLIESYINTMAYVSESIYYNGDLQRILSDRNYAKELPIDERYREYRRLSDVFISPENEDIVWQAGIYLRGDIPYTNDGVHIMPLNMLFERSDYMRFIYTVRRDKFYFSPPVNLYKPGVDEPTRAVTMLRPVRTTDGSARQICFVQVSVPVDEFLKVLTYANATDGSVTYLVDEYRQLIATTDEDAYWSMKRQRQLPINDDDGTWRETTIDGTRYYMLQRSIPKARWTLTLLIPEADIRAQGDYLTGIVITLTLLILAAIVLVAYLLANSYTARLRNLNARIQKVRSGELAVEHDRDAGHDEIAELFESFNEMTEELQKLMREQYRSGKAVKAAELRALQAQINPHFLYNTLDLINWEAFEHDAPEISEIAQNLAKFYRVSLNKGRPAVTIREELEHVRAYVGIENHHFDGSIFLHIDVPEEIQALGCINIILQPLVENSIMHGIAKDISRGECNIWISAKREGGDVVFTVTDDGPGMTERQIQEMFMKNTTRRASGYGVKNIQSRLQLSFGESYGIAYHSDAKSGTRASVRIPALTPEELETHLENL